MPTTDDIYRTVVQQLIAYLKAKPLHQRPNRIPTEGEVDRGITLAELGLDYWDVQAFGRWLSRRGLCDPLDPELTAHWGTIEDVVTAVIRYGSLPS